jgi:hypothetical protein
MAHAIVDRLDAHRFRYPDALLSLSDAGHRIGIPLPYDAELLNGLQGKTDDANARARATAWPQLPRFLASLAR